MKQKSGARWLDSFEREQIGELCLPLYIRRVSEIRDSTKKSSWRCHRIEMLDVYVCDASVNRLAETGA